MLRAFAQGIEVGFKIRISAHGKILGSACAPPAGFGASPKQSFSIEVAAGKVRDGGGAITSGRGARAPQSCCSTVVRLIMR
jgi:hypothetical protein